MHFHLARERLVPLVILSVTSVPFFNGGFFSEPTCGTLLLGLGRECGGRWKLTTSHRPVSRDLLSPFQRVALRLCSCAFFRSFFSSVRSLPRHRLPNSSRLLGVVLTLSFFVLGYWVTRPFMILSPSTYGDDFPVLPPTPCHFGPPFFPPQEMLYGPRMQG